jgi:DNA processing protein
MSRPRVAIVGSRKATRYGTDVASSIARELAFHGICIISGMALGIDGAAHLGALEAGSGGTIAVLGCGPDVVYPKAHARMHASIKDAGLVVSEYPPGTPPVAWRFPARNRIMAGLADAVIVVEAGEKSGALITAEFALDEGREVMAVPGSVFSRMSAGAHRLIGNGAALVENAADVMEVLGLEPGQQHLDVNPPRRREESLTSDEKSLLGSLDATPRQQDELAASAGLDPSRAAAALLSLELAGLARLDPGRGYTR